MMTLFWSATSPFARKVMITAHELGIADRITLQPTVTADEPEELLAVSPAGKLPVLLTEDGTAIADSRVICAYLDAEFGQNRLLPAGSTDRWKALTDAARADAATEAGILVRLERMRPEPLRSAQVEAKQLRKVMRSLDAFDAAHLRSEPFDVAGIALGAALGWLLLRLPDDRLLNDRPRLADWFAAISSRPSMQATLPPVG
ncbi:glutathione S-transferase family protein [Futiania mangrovi]|uniref:Glutathione S-transferase n=1 Tax=Futiania mangrovi TaxID=2959716 RepID=A0A9J6PEN5_9PROT|nr:glutathione S-transferase [Futiania mangrovii]MCP1337153.1 glutathione S-transferase [Futiania mangrovii]